MDDDLSLLFSNEVMYHKGKHTKQYYENYFFHDRLGNQRFKGGGALSA